MTQRRPTDGWKCRKCGHVYFALTKGCPLCRQGTIECCPHCNGLYKKPLSTPELGVVCPLCMRTISYGTLSRKSDRRRLLKLGERDGWVCGICGTSVDPNAKGLDAATRDHVLAKARGGPNAFANLQIAHALCNHKKGAT